MEIGFQVSVHRLSSINNNSNSNNNNNKDDEQGRGCILGFYFFICVDSYDLISFWIN